MSQPECPEGLPVLHLNKKACKQMGLKFPQKVKALLYSKEHMIKLGAPDEIMAQWIWDADTNAPLGGVISGFLKAP